VPHALVDAPEILADNGRLELDRGVTRLPGGNRLPVDIDRPIPIKKRAPSTLIVATGFGVAKPLGTARYVYVEEIGTVAWGVNSRLIGTLLKNISFKLAILKWLQRYLLMARQLRLLRLHAIFSCRWRRSHLADSYSQDRSSRHGYADT